MTAIGAGGIGLEFYYLSKSPALIETVVITGSATGWSLEYGGGQLTVSNATFQQSSGDGIVIEYGFGNTIFSGCSSTDNVDAGLSIAPSSDYASGDGSTITGCNFLRNGAEGIKAEVRFSYNSVVDNTGYIALSDLTVSVGMTYDYWGITEASGINATINDDEESGTVAAVFEPVLIVDIYSNTTTDTVDINISKMP